MKLEKFVSVAFCWCYLRHTTRTFDLPMEQKACLWIIYVTMPYASGRLLLFSFKAGNNSTSICASFASFALREISPNLLKRDCDNCQFMNFCCLRLPASSSFRRSLISWCRSSFMWQYHKSIRWAFLRMESLCCLGMKLISTLSSQDCPHPAPNSTELIAHSCSGLLLGLPLRKISNLGRAAGGDWHVGHDWFSGSERSERWTPKLSHEVSKAKPAHKSHWKDFLSLWKMRFWEKNLREKAFELCFNLRSWWVLKLVRPCCSLWLQWCCTRSAWSSNVFSRRAQRQRPSNWRPLLETWWNPTP